jgi:putative endonuclease
MFYVYMMQLKDSRIYVGHSNNPPRRHSEHESGKGCRTSGIFGAGDIIFTEEHTYRSSAAKRERQLKKWSRAKKQALINGNIAELKCLAKRRSS